MALTDQVSKEAPLAFWTALKKYWAFGLVAILALFVIAMAKKDKIIAAFTTAGSAQRGDKLPAFLRRWLGIATTATALAIAFLWSGDAAAAVAHVGGAGVLDRVLGFLGENWQIVGMAGLPLLGLTELGAPDVLDLKSQEGGDSVTATAPLTATAARSLYVRSSTKKIDKFGRPLVATDLNIEMATEVTMTAGDDDVNDDDLARLFAYVGISSPLMGVLTSPETHTGPVLDLVERFIGECFERSGDAPIDTIEAPLADTEANTVTKYLTRPFAQRWLKRPLSTCPWLPLLHDTNVSIGVAADTCLTAVSTNADITDDRVIKASISYVPAPVWFYPLVPYSRVDKPASGSNGLTFRGFGEAGPKCTQPVDFLHTLGHLSNLKGLPGNLTFDTVTHLYGSDFGLDDVANLAHLVKARIRAQYAGNVFGVNYAASGNYPSTTANAEGGMALDELLFLLLIQPSLDGEVKHLRQMKAGQSLQMRYTTSSTRTGEDAFYLGSLRKCSPAVVAEWRQLDGSRLPASVDAVREWNR